MTKPSLGQFSDFRRFVADSRPQFLRENVNARFRAALNDAFCLGAWLLEHIVQAPLHRDVFGRTGSLYLQLVDVLAGLCAGYDALSPVTCASLARIGFEAACNVKFIVGNGDPLKYADRYLRYGDIQMLNHDERKSPDMKQLSDADRKQILDSIPEWEPFKNKRGVWQVSQKLNHWTADEETNNVWRVADQVGWGNVYEGVYSATSTIIHGSARAQRAYRTPADRRDPIGDPNLTRRFAYLGADFPLQALQAAAEFFGVEIDRNNCELVRAELRESCKDVS